ncbi:unnamed protein product [Prorocentrum cordatum]|uniref:Uncharacterized protein n=1 Tax=Prorocentrum cordatum TaxID=2364126 RepID=A0ABN9U9B3_9DINO|nr:unnamed protein product [Polarella glacialis]
MAPSAATTICKCGPRTTAPSAWRSGTTARCSPSGTRRRSRTRSSWRGPTASPALAIAPASAPTGSADSGCVCPLSVTARAVFVAIPSRSELLSEAGRLRIGAFQPPATAACLAPCDGEVRAYVANGEGNVDESTVFECDGVYYKNMESVAEVAGYSFRNPPVFALAEEMTGRSVREEEALAEVEALLDHLFRHPNLPPFVSFRLIQRMVTSNPSPAYVFDVAQAFRTGEYNGETYSGQYGDLGATFAAILLHPEARGDLPSSSVGKLREPLVKLLHFLRSMGYMDLKGRQILMASLEDDIGQWPYAAPSVFNYYDVEYSPPGLSDGLFAPEFQIFTPPLALTWLNGMLSLVNTGELSRCEGGIGQHTSTCSIVEGQLNFSVSSNDPNDAFTEVSLLLTGGRIRDAGVFDAALNSSGGEDYLKAAMRTVVMSPEFHTLGDPEPAGQRPAAPEETPHQSRSYKAMVLLYLHGGADTFNLLVPTCTSLFAEYQTVRQNIALSQGQLLGISADTQACSTFGVHHGLTFVRDLYVQGQLAFVSNIGGLVQPTTKDGYRGTTPQCAGLFSHLDQQNGGMTLKCQVQGASPRGFGGRLADATAGEGYRTTSFSLAGTNIWSTGHGIGEWRSSTEVTAPCACRGTRTCRRSWGTPPATRMATSTARSTRSSSPAP